MAQKHLTARLHGRVQGVGFRFFAREEAGKMGLTGYVRNLPDDGVEVVAEGEEDTLILFLKRLREGPRSARVDEIKTSWQEPSNKYNRFDVTI